MLSQQLAKIETEFTERVCAANGPSAVVAVYHDGDYHEFATGIANLRTGAPVTTDTRFQIGSNTKMLTAFVLFRAIDQQLATLDDLVTHHIPKFQTPDENTNNSLTLRHLLTHTGGIPGNVFLDFGRGDDAIEKLVLALAKYPVEAPVGLSWGYSNAGTVIVGHVLEKLYKKPYAQIMQEQLFTPLGMTETTQLVEETILYSHAVGHLPNAEGGIEVTSDFLLPAAMAPAGATVTCSARDFLKFGKLMLNKGVTESGEALVSAETFELMISPAVKIPAPLTDRWMNHLMVTEHFDGHSRLLSGGQTSGQNTLFMVFPEQDAVLVAFANGTAAAAINAEALEDIVDDTLGLNRRIAPSAPDAPIQGIDLSRYIGTYESFSTRIRVEEHNGDLRYFCSAATELKITAGQEQIINLRGVGDHGFISLDKDFKFDSSFIDIQDGKANYLFLHGLFKRVDQ